MIGGSTGPTLRTVFYPNVSSQFCWAAPTAFHNKSIHCAAFQPSPHCCADWCLANYRQILYLPGPQWIRVIELPSPPWLPSKAGYSEQHWASFYWLETFMTSQRKNWYFVAHIFDCTYHFGLVWYGMRTTFVNNVFCNICSKSILLWILYIICLLVAVCIVM